MKPLAVSSYEVAKTPGVTFILLKGYLDAHTVEDFEQHTDSLISKGCLKLVLDLSELIYISSAGIGALMSLSQQLSRAGGGLVLLSPPEKIRKVLDLLGFAKIFHIAQEESEALKTLSALGGSRA